MTKSKAAKHLIKSSRLYLLPSNNTVFKMAVKLRANIDHKYSSLQQEMTKAMNQTKTQTDCGLQITPRAHRT